MRKVSAVTAEVTLEQDQFLPNEDVRVAVRVTNRSGQPLQLGKENDWITFSIQAPRSICRETIGRGSDGE